LYCIVLTIPGSSSDTRACVIPNLYMLALLPFPRADDLGSARRSEGLGTRMV